jgi:surfeit locus 1 family protein
MRIPSLKFSPPFWPTVGMLCIFVLLAGLGLWQLDRAEQKRQLLDRYELKAGTERIRLGGRMEVDSALRYQPAEVQGVMDTTHQFLLDNKVDQGRVGYHVLTPVRIAHSRSAVLVNRGWVPLGATRQQLPELPAPAGSVVLTGILDIPPDKVFVLGEGEDRDPGWPKVLQRIRLDLQQTQLGYPLLPAVLLLDPEQPYGFARDWRPVVFGPERHVGYAFQWFSLATALVIIYLVLNTRRVAGGNPPGGPPQ